ALAASGGLRALVQELADEVSAAQGLERAEVPDLGPAVLADQLRVMVYDYRQVGLDEDAPATRLTALRRSLPCPADAGAAPPPALPWPPPTGAALARHPPALPWPATHRPGARTPAASDRTVRTQHCCRTLLHQDGSDRRDAARTRPRRRHRAGGAEDPAVGSP